MSSKDFQVFLMQFSEKIQHAQTQSSFSAHELEKLDETIEGLLDLAQRVYSQELNELLEHHQIDENLRDMKDTIDAHLFSIQDFKTDHATDQLEVIYHGATYHRPLLDIPTAIQLYFGIAEQLTEYAFVTAYLARTDHYDIIQIYHFLRSRQH